MYNKDFTYQMHRQVAERRARGVARRQKAAHQFNAQYIRVAVAMVTQPTQQQYIARVFDRL